MKCSVCSIEIDDKYCSKCGQYHKDEKITSISILKDLLGNLFSLEKSFFKNIKVALVQPKTLISNYWNGFRGYYYSPSRFLTIASLFFLLQILFFNDFFGLIVTSKVAQNFTILLLLIVLFSFSTYVIYLKYRKSFFEHIILNIYNVSLWSILFVPLSILFSILHTPKTIKTGFIFLFLLLIIIWNNKTFEMNKFKRFIFVLLNCLFLVIVGYFVYKLGASTS